MLLRYPTLPSRLAPFGVLLCLTVTCLAAPGKVDFNREVRPILSENCFACHGPDKGARKAKMRLDQRESALDKEAFVLGQPEKSELIARVVSTDPEEIMPPLDSHKKLTAAQKETLRRWIAEGAEYQPHWSYILPKRPALPVMTGHTSAHPVDAFICQVLASQGVAPSREADRPTLLRRLSLDLTGLPPTPEEVRAFMNDAAPEAYERVVDRLLASPHFGERMAVPWLDVVRYADTVGYHGDQNVNVFPYRDYVIESFNRNKPFDQFTIEQIAGDLLPHPTQEQRVATCFNRLNMMTREGGAQPKEYLAKYAADRVRTVSGAWLGSTLGCAECHDHKFDPFTAKDFYSMEAFFADVKQWGVYADYGYTPNPDLKGFNNDYPFPPEISVSSTALQERIAKLREQVSAAAGEAARRDAHPSELAAWRAQLEAFLVESPTGWEVPEPNVTLDAGAAPKPAKKKASNRKAEIQKVSLGAEQPKVALPEPATQKTQKNQEPTDAAPEAPAAAAEAKPAALFEVDASRRITLASKSPQKITAILQPRAPLMAALRVELLPSPARGGSILAAGGKPESLKVEAILQRAGQKPQPLSFRLGEANYEQPRYAGGAIINGLKAGWALSPAHLQEANTAVWLLESPAALSAGDEVHIVLEGVNLACVRLSVSPLAPDDLRLPEIDPALQAALTRDDFASAPVVQAAWLRSTGTDMKAFPAVERLEREIAECRHGQAQVLVTEALPQPLSIRLLHRGNWQDDTGELLEPGLPHFLSPTAVEPGQRLTRLDLARWIVSPQNPLTARVFMNRLWKQCFGTGLSATVDDLGAQGEWPTHPELLDWLAVEFRESGWDVKHMVKLLVTSATYRQSANLRPELREIDPNNRLLASQNPRRLEAEFVRDNALAIAGLLNPALGGPAVHPYQPARYYENLQFPSREYAADLDERQYRRGLYTHWQRTFLHPMLANFDAPSREECTASRTIANTPQQALTLLNDPTFMEAARVFAAKLLSGTPTDSERLSRAFQEAVARPIKDAESESLTRFLAAQRDYYQAHADDAAKVLHIGLAPVPAQADPAELAAWTMVARVVLNLHETITRY